MQDEQALAVSDGHSASGSDPLRALVVACDRLKALCGVMEKLIRAANFDEDALDRVIDALRYDFPQAFDFEAEHLLPMVVLRAKPDDDVRRVTQRLLDNHRISAAATVTLLPRLESARKKQIPIAGDHPLCRAMVQFSVRQREHQSLIAAVLLPIGRLRFQPTDSATLTSLLPGGQRPNA